MDERCVLVEDLGELLELPLDDPRMLHVADCPRCQGRLLSYRVFLRRDEVLEGARDAEADACLREFLEETIRGKSAAGGAHEVGEARGAGAAHGIGEAHEAGGAPGAGEARGTGSNIGNAYRPRTDPFRRLRDLRRSRRILWPSFATLAVVSAVVAVVLLRGAGERPPIVPRGDQGEPGEVGPLPAPAEWLPAGGCVLRWAGVKEADAYRIVMLDAGLAEVARLEATTQTTFTLNPDLVRDLRADRRAAYWQVEALSAGDAIASSPPQAWLPPKR
ncbi:MAG: hypothetical protein FJY88_10165 [Candidatus Eisenbacteria bacterium]|nr:hypothetical protein [Candidatus Eisenbacteria bacterium]